MHHCHTSKAEAENDGLAQGHVTWFGLPFAKDVPFNRGSLPGGYEMCSIEDMAHILIAQINGGRYGDRQLLSAEGIAEIHRPAVATESPDIRYGMGWYGGPTSGVPSLFHDGDNANSAASMAIIPEEQLGFMVMFNANGTFMVKAHRQIASGIVAAMMGEEPQPYKAPQELTMVAGSVVVPAAVSLLWVAWNVYRFIRRRRKDEKAPGSALGTLWVVVLPLVVEIGLLLVLLVGIPTLWGLPMEGLILMFPDMATLIFGSVLALAGWGLARTGLTLLPVLSRSRAAVVPV
jgi:hypothetical protein